MQRSNGPPILMRMSDADSREPDPTFMQAALDQAAKALEDDVGGPFGAIIVHRDQVVGRGRNQVLANRDPTAHAEVVAIREAARRLGTHELTGSQIYTSCEPCPMCLAAIYWARIDQIYFAADRNVAAGIGFDDQWLYDELPRPLTDRKIPSRVILASEATELMQRWSRREGRQLY